MVKEFVCIVCPNGCTLRTEEKGGVITVMGNTCPKGEEYAKTELKTPTRTLTTTVATSFPLSPVLPVRTSAAIPKGEINNAMSAINKLLISTALKCGDSVVKDFIITGVDLIATDDIVVN
ncbi:MAG: DUF1667 domain-containing protein [Oscillospiraceae bacterium]|nr:DUF1667 domain-containing protein [Oscillospiraceae bacterium]